MVNMYNVYTYMTLFVWYVCVHPVYLEEGTAHCDIFTSKRERHINTYSTGMDIVPGPL